MKKIIVLIGYPGAGKTTFARAFVAKHPNYKPHDVYEYIKKYKRPDGTLISEEYTIIAYTEMYQDLKKREGDIILELGTNHHDFNAEQLKLIMSGADLNIFLCLLSKDECLAREEKRERVIDKEALLKKFERNFPEVHEAALEKIGLGYHYLQMGQPVEDQVKFVEEIIGG
ncbi:MAG: AAA family ATPase [Patescibacteria group bacterium]|jgi:adenylate kinase family enzyme